MYIINWGDFVASPSPSLQSRFAQGVYESILPRILFRWVEFDELLKRVMGVNTMTKLYSHMNGQSKGKFKKGKIRPVIHSPLLIFG